MTKIAPTNEILGAFLANANGSNGELQADPKAYVFSHYNTEIPQEDIRVVENTESRVNLALPYYSAIDTVTASKEDDEAIDVSGGFEIVAIIIALTTAGIVAGVGVAAGTAGVAAGIAADKK